MYTLKAGQFQKFDFTGVDSLGNPAPVTLVGFDVTNHAIGYAVQTGPAEITVVSRGPLGSFNVDLAFHNGSDVPIGGQVLSFTVVAGDAVNAVIVPGAPAPIDGSTPPIPAGW